MNLNESCVETPVFEDVWVMKFFEFSVSRRQIYVENSIFILIEVGNSWESEYDSLEFR